MTHYDLSRELPKRDSKTVLEAAREELARLCQPGNWWRVSIPPRQDWDSDLILGAALAALAASEAEAQALRARVEAAIEDTKGCSSARWVREAVLTALSPPQQVPDALFAAAAPPEPTRDEA